MVRLQLDWKTFKIFSNLSNSMILKSHFSILPYNIENQMRTNVKYYYQKLKSKINSFAFLGSENTEKKVSNYLIRRKKSRREVI